MAQNNIITVDKPKITVDQNSLKYRSSEVNMLMKTIKQHSIKSSVLRKRIKEDVTGLRNSARLYYSFIAQEINKINRLQKKIPTYKQILNSETGEVKKQFLDLGEEQQNFKQFLIKLTIETENFVNDMRSYLNLPPIQTLYMGLTEGNIENFSSQQLLGLFNIDIKDLLYLEGQQGQNWSRRLQLSISQMEELKNSPDAKYTNVLSSEYEKLNKVLDEVVRRYQEHHSKTHRIMWTWGIGHNQDTRKWGIFYKEGELNRGNFVEAYIRCVYNRQQYSSAFSGIINLNDSKSIVYDLGADDFVHSLQQNDNISGIFIDDISNFAIKAGRAEAMGIKPCLEIAAEILTLGEDNEDLIQNILFKKFDELQQQGMSEKISGIITYEIQNDLKSLENN